MSKARRYGKGWDLAQRVLDPRISGKVLIDEIEKGLDAIGQLGVAQAVKDIRDKKYAANSKLTEALKGSSTPLVAGADLMQSITHRLDKSGRKVWIGVNRNSPHGRSKKGSRSVAEVLHDGATIDVGKHPGVRQAVMAKLRETADGQGGGNSATAQSVIDDIKKRRGKGKLVWVIPGRKYLLNPLQDPGFRKKAQARMQTAAANVVKRLMEGGAR